MPSLLARMSRATPEKSDPRKQRGQSSSDDVKAPQTQQDMKQQPQSSSLDQSHTCAKPPPHPGKPSDKPIGESVIAVIREEEELSDAEQPAVKQAELRLVDRRTSTVVVLDRQVSACKSASSVASINPDNRDMVKKARRIIVKASTKVISRACDGRLALSRIGNMVEQLESLIRSGRQIVLVTSGVTCSGKQRLKREQILNSSPLQAQGLEMGHNVPYSVQKQAAAASGQSALMGLYDQMFGQMDIGVAQLLLGRGDLQHADHTQGLKETVDYLLSINTIPIINWNDAIFTEAAPSCGATGAAWAQDNNHLASTLADVLDAELLVLLSNSDGLHTKAKEQIPAYCPELHQEEVDMSCGVCPALVCKNVASKIDCAWMAAQKGIPTLILNGKGTDPAILRAVSGDVIGTLFDTHIAEQLMRERSNSSGDIDDGELAEIGSRKVTSDSAASLGGSSDESLKEALSKEQ